MTRASIGESSMFMGRYYRKREQGSPGYLIVVSSEPHPVEWQKSQRSNAMNRQSTQRRGINPESQPSGAGCVECLKSGGWWLHLRRCAECGHIGCCDNSGFEPGEDWFYDYDEAA